VTKTLTPIPTEDTRKTAAASGSKIHIWSRPQNTWNSGGVNPFTGGPSGLSQEVPHVIKDSTPSTVFLLFFMEVIQLLVVETNKY